MTGERKLQLSITVNYQEIDELGLVSFLFDNSKCYYHSWFSYLPYGMGLIRMESMYLNFCDRKICEFEKNPITQD